MLTLLKTYAKKDPKFPNLWVCKTFTGTKYYRHSFADLRNLASYVHRFRNTVIVAQNFQNCERKLKVMHQKFEPMENFAQIFCAETILSKVFAQPIFGGLLLKIRLLLKCVEDKFDKKFWVNMILLCFQIHNSN